MTSMNATKERNRHRHANRVLCYAQLMNYSLEFTL